jgi:hypothetical protein
MTDLELQLLSELDYGIISEEVFLRRFPIDLKENSEYIEKVVIDAIQIGDVENLEMVLKLIWVLDEFPERTQLLNMLLIAPNHISHQRIARELQTAKSPSTVPYVRQALAKGFDYLEYTCSESNAIAKWFSWILFAIGTEEAIQVMKDYSTASDEGIRAEMLYRLKNVNQGP